jgi:uncharacterized protein
MKALILHGWGSTSKDNWFPWLKATLEKEGYAVACPDLPDPQNPSQAAWLETVREHVDPDTILVGHSLGAVLILRLLENMKAKSAYLVAGFDQDLGIPEIANFFKQGFDYESIRSNCSDITLLYSDNDPYIKSSISVALAERLRCKKVLFKGKGHLSAGTAGDRMFPELKDMILNGNN